jgi:hypothetical protein
MLVGREVKKVGQDSRTGLKDTSALQCLGFVPLFLSSLSVTGIIESLQGADKCLSRCTPGCKIQQT